jgi:hypothetical protein
LPGWGRSQSGASVNDENQPAAESADAIAEEGALAAEAAAASADVSNEKGATKEGRADNIPRSEWSSAGVAQSIQLGDGSTTLEVLTPGDGTVVIELREQGKKPRRLVTVHSQSAAKSKGHAAGVSSKVIVDGKGVPYRVGSQADRKSAKGAQGKAYGQESSDARVAALEAEIEMLRRLYKSDSNVAQADQTEQKIKQKIIAAQQAESERIQAELAKTYDINRKLAAMDEANRERQRKYEKAIAELAFQESQARLEAARAERELSRDSKTELAVRLAELAVERAKIELERLQDATESSQESRR